MTKTTILPVLALLALAPVSLPGQTQSTTYKPGDFQTTNANYPTRNPFYFEGRVDWDLLKIEQPSNAWEFAQRGIHEQDDLEDNVSAMNDYKQAISLNSLANGTCQLITSFSAGSGQTFDPPPCMFTARLRLGNLLKSSDPQSAIALFKEVLTIDPLRLGVNALMGDAYVAMASKATDAASVTAAYQNAVAAYKAELALSPVTAVSIAATGDQANNAHVHWALAEVYRLSGGSDRECYQELVKYLQATEWHSDTYPWRVQLAKSRLAVMDTRRKLTHD